MVGGAHNDVTGYLFNMVNKCEGVNAPGGGGCTSNVAPLLKQPNVEYAALAQPRSAMLANTLPGARRYHLPVMV